MISFSVRKIFPSLLSAQSSCMSDMQWMQPIIIMSSFAVHSCLIYQIFPVAPTYSNFFFFQCSVFIYTFYAPILSDFIFFSSQCSHITADISLCGPRRRPPHHRLWFWLSGKKLTQLAHANINQVLLNWLKTLFQSINQ